MLNAKANTSANAINANNVAQQQVFTSNASNKLYSVVGTSVLNNVLTLRFANNLQQRITTLKANKHTNVKLINTLNNAQLTQTQCIQFLLTQTAFNSCAQTVALCKAFLAKHNAS